MFEHIAVFGASGAIGNAIIQSLASQNAKAEIHAFTRATPTPPSTPQITYRQVDYLNEYALEQAAECVTLSKPLDLVVVATGILHDEEHAPEKALKEITANNLQHIYTANTVIPALILKHFSPCLSKENRSVFAALSARVGSVSDNRLGGWYSYRCSKSALNMLIKTASIEIARRNKQAILVGLHPGTVDSTLSKPFQRNVPKDHLFTPEFSAEKLLQVLKNVSTKDTGLCFDYAGEEVIP